jgi:signal transduction histidine kinase
LKRQISLKLFVGLVFLLTSLLLVGVYSYLSDELFSRGMNSNEILRMEEALQSYLKETPAAARAQLSFYHGYYISSHWDQMPDTFRRDYAIGPPDRRFMIAHEVGADETDGFNLLTVLRHQSDETTYYVARLRRHVPDMPALAADNTDSGPILIAVGVAVAALLAGVLLLLTRWVAKPMKDLETWTRSLGPENLEQTPPDFLYPELNRMAELVRSSLSSVREGLARERKFLRYASHELRTPIAVIRNNIELFPKIDTLAEPQRSNQQRQIMARIDRAGLNMQHLTETLLWLSRDNVENMKLKKIALDALIHHLVDELTYLLKRKDVELKVETAPCLIDLPDIPTQIVLRNLIRNAFQHTEEGQILISQQGPVITVVNPQLKGDGEQDNLGFGFGLQLISQLSEKLGWHYQVESQLSTYKTTISLLRRVEKTDSDLISKRHPND